MLLLASISGATTEIFGFPLETPIDEAMRGASRDGAPSKLQLQHSTLLPASAAATQQWLAESLWWYASPRSIPARFGSRTQTLQIAIDQQGQLFWLLLTVASRDCNADQRWLEKALSARYQVAELPDPITDTVNSQAPIYHSEGNTVLVTATCTTPELVLEYLLPERYQNAYEQRTSTVTAANARSGSATKDLRAQALADQSLPLLEGTRDILYRWLGVALGEDGVTNQAPGSAQSFDPSQTTFAHLAGHPLLKGATHTLEADAKGGITRMTTKLPDPDFTLQQRWERVLRTRFGSPTKDTDKHQIYRFGAQRLVLRREDKVLRIAYQDLTRRKAERTRLAAERAVQYRESTKGL